MNRQAVIFATVAPALGLGLLLLSKRQQIGPLAGETVEGSVEGGPKKLAEDIEDTRMKIEETREALERAVGRAKTRAAAPSRSAWDNAGRTATGALMAVLGIGLLSALVIYIYAPERHQQEQLWHTTKSLLAPVGGTLALLGRWWGYRR